MLIFKHEQLPDWCYVTVPGNPAGQNVGRVLLGHTGYWLAHEINAVDDEDATRKVREANAARGITRLQAFCMRSGSLVGWDAPGADPDWVTKHHPDKFTEATAYPTLPERANPRGETL